MIPLRGVIAFPTTALTFDVGREKSINAIEHAMNNDKRVFVVAQKDAITEIPHMGDVYLVGTVVLLKQLIKLPDGSVRVFADGICRALLTDIIEGGEIQFAEIFTVSEDRIEPDDRIAAISRVIKAKAATLTRAKGLSAELKQAISGECDINVLCDLISANLLTDVGGKQAVLECMDPNLRLETLLNLITKELSIIKLEAQIAARVHENMDKANHDYYLREQMKVISEELGDESEDEDILDLKKRLSKSAINGEPKERCERELKRLIKMTMHSPESSVSYNYIDYLINLPWNKFTEGEISIAKARETLDKDHYGMKDVKDRLLEYLGVRALNPELRSPIICLVGPPGVGKTSIAKSVAKALGRKFAQMSLGGVRDEAELRGHRRTYVGAIPGRVISAINQCGSMDPVFLLDEIDKLARDMHGDPASALLEILDPEQNSRFRDHYIDAPIDLSKVMFITTANTTDTIDRALLDRMEIIEVSSYTIDEKLQIAKRHLLPKQIKAHGLKASKLRISDALLKELIDGYTREAGVRSLERLLAKVCRKTALYLSENEGVKSVTVNQAKLEEFLGSVRYTRQALNDKDVVGVVNGLAWTSVGGEVMPVEAVSIDGSGVVEMTGKLGDVMKESAKLAQTTIRIQSGLSSEYFKSHDMHVHVPEGAVPKDGPSAGVAITCAMLSAVTGIPARNDIAMTGEITLTGRVLPIGGVKEKLLAAYRMGLSNILLPRENEKDLDEIDKNVINDMHVKLIDNVEDAISSVLTRPINKQASQMRAV